MKQIFIVLLTLFSFSLLAQSNLRINKNSNIKPSSELEQASQNPENSENNTNTKSFHINQHHNEQDNNQSPFEAVKGKKEILAKRDQFSKTYQNEDGSFTALIGAGPIHYNNNGVWEDIDTKIIQNSNISFPYSNTKNIMESHFGATINKGVKSKTIEGEIIEFINPTMYWEANNQAIQIQYANNSQVEIQGNRAIYPNIYGNISAEYSVKTGQRKLNYIIPPKESLGTIPNNADFLVFTEEITLPNNFKMIGEIKEYNKLKKEYTTIRGVFVVDQNEKVIYSYEAPAIVENYSSEIMGLPSQFMPEISYQVENDRIVIYTKVKANWLNENVRVFPLAIDPTGTAYPFTANYSSGQTYSSGGGSGDIVAGYAGRWYRGWLTFNMSGLPSMLNVTAATVSLYIGNKGGTMSGSTNTINIGHTSFDLSRLQWINNFTVLYNAITAANNAGGAYNYMQNQNIGTWANVNLKPGANTMALDEIERKSGNTNAFFPVSFSPAWGSGTTSRYYVIAGYNDPNNKPYLSITYTQVDPYQHAAYNYANAVDIGDVGYIQIGNVSIGSINNNTAITNYAANASVIYRNTPTGYNKYNMSTNVTPGNNYNLNVTYRDLGGNQGKIAVWVDWNEDGDFADANEYIDSVSNVSDNDVKSFTISVPAGVSAGTKRLRIRSIFNEDNIGSSNYNTIYDYGETEDYSLIVDAPPAIPSCATLIGPQNNATGIAQSGLIAWNASLSNNPYF